MTKHFYDPQNYPALKRVWDIEKQAHVDQWVTLTDFDMFLCDGRKLNIPAGTVYDKASSPPAFWWYMPRDDNDVIIAALVHDYLYEKQMIAGEWIKRSEADQIFYELLRQAGMRYTKAKLAYLAVRVGGWRYFNKTARALGNSYYEQ